MTTLTATYRVVTPMFLGGAEPTMEAELRVPSFKGALRFWWRALAWARGIRDVAELHMREAELFGHSKTDVGQSKVLLRLSAHQSETLKAGMILGNIGRSANQVREIVGEGVRYLGYGLMESFDGKSTKGGRLTRPCLAAPFEFGIDLAFHPNLNESAQKEVIAAMKLLGLCGGLGSRNRRGFGSLSLVRLSGYDQDSWKPPVSVAAWTEELKSLAGSNGSIGSLPLWTALAVGRTKAVVLRDHAQWPLEMLARLGRDFVFFRSWGRDGKVLRLASEQLFRDDHDLMKKDKNQRVSHPRRIVFGLPHNYGKRQEEQVDPADPQFDRRASPLFFHIHQPDPSHQSLGVVAFLPSQFLPSGRDHISVGGKQIELAGGGDGEFWKPAEDFLERLRSGSGKERFEEAALVKL
jgi:CRISPR-associated protein Cmr1